jgi:hypothetical protein
LWSGAIFGLGAGGAMPMSDEYRAERAFAVGAVAIPIGLGAGLLFAGDVSPTVARVRIIDLIGVAGGMSAGGLYLAAAGNGERHARAAEGFAAAGALAGITVGWLVTSGMPKDTPRATPPAPAAPAQAPSSSSHLTPPPPRLTLHPMLAPTPGGGATIGVSGTLL